MLATDAEFDIRAGCAPQLAGHLDQLANAILIERNKRIFR